MRRDELKQAYLKLFLCVSVQGNPGVPGAQGPKGSKGERVSSLIISDFSLTTFVEVLKSALKAF